MDTRTTAELVAWLQHRADITTDTNAYFFTDEARDALQQSAARLEALEAERNGAVKALRDLVNEPALYTEKAARDFLAGLEGGSDAAAL